MRGLDKQKKYRTLLIFFIVLSIITLKLPYSTSYNLDNPSEIKEYNWGGQFISVYISIFLSIVMLLLFIYSKKKIGKFLRFTLSFLNIILLYLIYLEINWQLFWMDFYVSTSIGFYLLSSSVISIFIVQLMQLIRFRAFTKGKYKYEDIIDDDFQKLE